MVKRHRVVVIALGGNALITEGQRGTIAEQFENTRKSLDGIVYCLKQGYGVVDNVQDIVHKKNGHDIVQ